MNAERMLQHFERLSEAPDAVPRLRRFILDLAVRGKLVEQDHNDEPATELLKRIQTEKTRLVAEGKIKSEKVIQNGVAMPAVSARLPEGWLWTHIQNVCTSVTDGDHLAPPKSEIGIPFLVIGNVRSQIIEFVGCRHVPDSYYKQIDTIRRPTKGDVLYTLVGSYGIPVVVRDTRPFCVQRHIGILRPSKYVNLDFLARLLASKLVFDQATECATGIAQKTVPLAGLRAIRIPIPPLAEQHRIVAKVNELMALCDDLEAAKTEREQSRDRLVAVSLQRLNQPADDEEVFRKDTCFTFDHLSRLTTSSAHIKQLRQTILNLAVRGNLVPQDANDEPALELLKRNSVWRTDAIQRKQIREPRKPLNNIGSNEFPYVLPSGWSWARLGEIIYIQSGDGLISENMKNGNIPVFGGNGINGYHDISNVNEPSIVIGRVGYYCGSIHTTPAKAWVTDNAFITQYCKDLILMRFLVLLLNGTNLKENESATAQPVISGSKIYPIVIGLPPLAEQHRIVAKVDELMAFCDQLEAQLTITATDSRRLLEAVLYEALTPTPQEAA